MLSAPRMVAAILLAAVGFLASELIKPLIESVSQFGRFSFVNAALGAVIGWTVIGGRVGRGVSAAIGNGITGAVALLFWGLFLHAGYEMLRLALRRRYDGPLEALNDMFRIGLDWVVMIATVPVLGMLFVGGIIAAVLAEVSARYWR